MVLELFFNIARAIGCVKINSFKQTFVLNTIPVVKIKEIISSNRPVRTRVIIKINLITQSKLDIETKGQN